MEFDKQMGQKLGGIIATDLSHQIDNVSATPHLVKLNKFPSLPGNKELISIYHNTNSTHRIFAKFKSVLRH